MTDDLSSRLKGLRILILEDEPILAFELIDELERIGAFPVGPITSVDEALRLVRADTPWDAALVNVFLRGNLSFPAVDLLIERGVPFLFVTGDDALVREHYPQIASHPKPSDLPQIIEALGTLIAVGRA